MVMARAREVLGRTNRHFKPTIKTLYALVLVLMTVKLKKHAAVIAQV